MTIVIIPARRGIVLCIVNQSFMRILIVYYSLTSNNELLAKELQEKLGADLFRIETRRKYTTFSIMWDILLNRTPEIKDFYHARNLYDKYIFVAPVWAGRVASPLRAFLLQEKSRIHDYSFITLCGGLPRQKDKLFKTLTKVVGHSPTQVVELSINDFISETDGHHSLGKGYEFQRQDLKFFKQKIDDFVAQQKAVTLAKAV